MKPLGIIIPWFGKELKGGAEQQAWQVASRLAQRGHSVEILTTCCRAFQDDWAQNHYRARACHTEGLLVRRFAVDRRNRSEFDRVNGTMLQIPPEALTPEVSPVSAADAEVFARQNINSKALLSHLQYCADAYHAFVFLPYLYGPILYGVPLVANKAYLQPCLHDEVYAYLPQVRQIMGMARRLLFNSEGEAELARRLYGQEMTQKGIIVGEGIELPSELPAGNVKDHGLYGERFLLCLGRRCPEKNTDLLVRAYASFHREKPATDLKLVLAGPGSTSYQGAVDGVLDLGLVEEGEKQWLLANCLALCQPSRNESYSRAMMEAWFAGRPVIAHRRCLATALAVEKADGGWLADSVEEWSNRLGELDGMTEEELARRGAEGHRYAQNHASWDKTMERYEVVLGLNVPESATARNDSTPIVPSGNASAGHSGRKSANRVALLAPCLREADAVSNDVIGMYRALAAAGYQAAIFANDWIHSEPAIQKLSAIRPWLEDPEATLIYHYSMSWGTGLQMIREAKCRKIIKYHNVTPPEFFHGLSSEYEHACQGGRLELDEVSRLELDLFLADSEYSIRELIERGAEKDRSAVVPPFHQTDRLFAVEADLRVLDAYQDGSTNLLTVGRIAPNKGHRELINAFAVYHHQYNACSRLFVVGKEDPRLAAYTASLHEQVGRLELKDAVLFTSEVSESLLKTYYLLADAFLLTSQHEGFGVPLIEAMAMSVPLIALGTSAVPGTIGDAGLVWEENDPYLMAESVHQVIQDQSLSAALSYAGWQRYQEQFSNAQIQRQFLSLLGEIACTN